MKTQLTQMIPSGSSKSKAIIKEFERNQAEDREKEEAKTLIAALNRSQPNFDAYEAKLRLEKAAPDLLAALKAVVRVADRDTDEFAVARAAIAKAEGINASPTQVIAAGLQGVKKMSDEQFKQLTQ